MRGGNGMKRIALLALVAFAGACVTLMALPMNDMPCQITVTHKVARFVPTSKNHLAGEIRHFDLTEDLVGVGRITGSRLVCEVTFTGRG